jgi:hypothetical protein
VKSHLLPEIRNLYCYDILIYNLWFKLEVKMPLDPKPIKFASENAMAFPSISYVFENDIFQYKKIL